VGVFFPRGEKNGERVCFGRKRNFWFSPNREKHTPTNCPFPARPLVVGKVSNVPGGGDFPKTQWKHPKRRRLGKRKTSGNPFARGGRPKGVVPQGT